MKKENLKFAILGGLAALGLGAVTTARAASVETATVDAWAVAAAVAPEAPAGMTLTITRMRVVPILGYDRTGVGVSPPDVSPILP